MSKGRSAAPPPDGPNRRRRRSGRRKRREPRRFRQMFPESDARYDRWFNVPPEQRPLEFWVVKKVAPKLDLSEGRVYALIGEGRLPYVKISGRYYVHMPTLLDGLKGDDGLPSGKPQPRPKRKPNSPEAEKAEE